MEIKNLMELLDGKCLRNTATAKWIKSKLTYNEKFLDTDEIFAGTRPYDGGTVIGYRLANDSDTLVDIGCVGEWHIKDIRDVTKNDIFRIENSYKQKEFLESFEPMKKPKFTYSEPIIDAV